MIRSSSSSCISSSTCQSVNPWSCFIFSPYPLSNILSITPASFVVCPLSGWCSISINTHRACWAGMWKKNVAVHCWTLQSQRFTCSSTVNRAYPLFSTGHTESCMVSPCLELNSAFSLFVGGQRILETERLEVGELEWFGSKQVRPGSEEVCCRRGLRGSVLSVGLQKVNYVLVGGSLCHRQCCLSILGKNTEKMSQFHIKDIAVTVLILTVAVLCCSFSSNWTLKYILYVRTVYTATALIHTTML